MYAIFKTMPPTKEGGKHIVKVLTGRDSICCEFTLVGHATYVKRWKTVAGAERFMNARPTFKSAHQADGSIIEIKEIR